MEELLIHLEQEACRLNSLLAVFEEGKRKGEDIFHDYVLGKLTVTLDIKHRLKNE